MSYETQGREALTEKESMDFTVDLGVASTWGGPEDKTERYSVLAKEYMGREVGAEATEIAVFDKEADAWQPLELPERILFRGELIGAERQGNLAGIVLSTLCPYIVNEKHLRLARKIMIFPERFPRRRAAYEELSNQIVAYPLFTTHCKLSY